MRDDLAEEELKKYAALCEKRDYIFKDDWQSISNYFLPQDSDIQVEKTEGVSGWTDQIYDTTPIQAAQTFASGDYNWLTPPQQPWAEYVAPREMKADDDAIRWLGQCSDIVMMELARSNFYSIRALSALGIGVFATDFMLCEEGKRTTLNFRHAKIGTYAIEEDDEGIVDTTRREFELTYRQIEMMFSHPGDEIPQKMSDQAKGSKGGQKRFKVLHSIFPRGDSERLPGRQDGPNKPFASVYISVEFKTCMRISGYDEQPALVPRFAKWGTESPWGFGPAYLALPDARQLNYMAQYMDAAAELHLYPRVRIPDNLEGDVDLRAGGITVYDSGNPKAQPEEWGTISDYKLGLDLMQKKRDQINEAFFVPAFKLLNSQPLLDKEMTAYEISQRLAEQLQNFTPALGRRVPEFINPLMRRVFGICYRAGKFPPPPDSMLQQLGAGRRGLVMPDILITSRISDALKALKNRGTQETFQFVAPLAENKPELWDNFVLDDVVTEYGHNSGMAPDLFRPKEGPNSIAALRAQRAKIAQQQRAAQLAEQIGKAGKGLEQSPDFMKDQAKEAFEGATGKGRKRAA